MKKSECYRQAQIAVLGAEHLEPNEKLEILSVLMTQEEIHKTCEELEEKKESEEQ